MLYSPSWRSLIYFDILHYDDYNTLSVIRNTVHLVLSSLKKNANKCNVMVYKYVLQVNADVS